MAWHSMIHRSSRYSGVQPTITASASGCIRRDKFPAWVASLSLNNVEAALAEMDRAIAQGARGIQIFTNVNGMALDDPSLFPIFGRPTNHHRVGIWMHPAR